MTEIDEFMSYLPGWDFDTYSLKSGVTVYKASCQFGAATIQLKTLDSGITMISIEGVFTSDEMSALKAGDVYPTRQVPYVSNSAMLKTAFKNWSEEYIALKSKMHSRKAVERKSTLEVLNRLKGAIPKSEQHQNVLYVDHPDIRATIVVSGELVDIVVNTSEPKALKLLQFLADLENNP